MLQSALSAGATLVAVAFALTTYERWRDRRRAHELAWAAALAIFAVASTCLWFGASSGWNRALFRGFFAAGAVVDVPILALGTVYLLWGRRRGDQAAAVVALFSAFAIGVTVAAPTVHRVPAHRLPRGADVFPGLPVALAAVGSGVGSLVVIGGAAWSAWRYRRGRMAAANLLIAAGTSILGAGGLFNSVLGDMAAFAVALAAGITVMFAGFLVAAAPTTTAGAASAR